VGRPAVFVTKYLKIYVYKIIGMANLA